MRGMWSIKVKDHGGPAELGIRRRGKCDGAGNGKRTGMMSDLKVQQGNQEDHMIH